MLAMVKVSKRVFCRVGVSSDQLAAHQLAVPAVETPRDSERLLGCPLGNLVSIEANKLALCLPHKNRMFGQTAQPRAP